MNISDLTLKKVQTKMPTISFLPVAKIPAMPENSDTGKLKVCCTCSFWSYQYKGFCRRLEQGVGKFYICEDWNAVAADAGESPSDAQKGSQAIGIRV